MPSGAAQPVVLWPGDLRGSWHHLCATTAAGGWHRGEVHDHGAR